MFTRHEWEGAPQHDQTLGPRYIARSTLIRKVLGKVKPVRTLDIGCGSGNITRHVADYSKAVHATDLSPKAIEVAQANLADARNVTFESIDLFNCSGAEKAHLAMGFDMIVLSEVLEHLDEDEAALAVIHGLLPLGGRLLLTVPGDPHQWSVDDELSGHRRRYTKEELQRKLHRAGFEVEQMTNWGFPFTRALTNLERRMMGNGEAGDAGSRSLVRLLIRPASLLFRMNAAVEPMLSFADAGVGYVVLARRVEQLQPAALAA